MLGYGSVLWGSYFSIGQSDHSMAMSQCSGVVMTSWGKVDIARISGYGSVQWSRHDSMGHSDHSKDMGDQSGGYRMLYTMSERCEDGCYA